MALSSLLDIVNRAQDELGLVRSGAVAASTDPQARQLFALANAAGRAIARRHAWGDLITLATITTVGGTSDYAVPGDFDRLVPQTHWDRSSKLRIGGPDTPQADRFRRESTPTTPSLHRIFRQIGSTAIRVFPTPAASGQTLVYEYVSKKWARGAGGAAQLEFSADADISVFNPDLMVRELKWRFRAAKGFSADAEKAESDDLVKQLIAADTGMPTLCAASHAGLRLLGAGNIPDSGYGL
jgi:hypothetical protein